MSASDQAATVEVDTYPGKKWPAHVASISPASGAEFSVLPAQNATGNWVKIVQRIPVRLAIDGRRSCRRWTPPSPTSRCPTCRARCRLAGPDQLGADLLHRRRRDHDRATGWIANRFGRKRIFIICSAGFTIASVLCGLAQDISQMVLFRLLQGVFGAALVPLSQAVMLDSYALHEARRRRWRSGAWA
jgi:hypothetical protein